MMPSLRISHLPGNSRGGSASIVRAKLGAEIAGPYYEVVGSVEDGRALLKTAEELKPDVVLLDIGMPLLNGLMLHES